MGGRGFLRAAVVLVLAAGPATADTFIFDSHTPMVQAHGELRLSIAAGPETGES